MTTAPINKMTDLHSRLADAMSDALDAEVRRIEITKELFNMDLEDLDEDTAKQINTALSLAPTARVDNGLLKTVAGFLKDNSITSDLGANEEDETTKRLKELQSKRRVAATPLSDMH